jgi:hypothetical protein
MDWRDIELSLRLSTLTTLVLLILATRFLVGLLPLAVEVFRRSRRSLAHYPTPYDLGLLRLCQRMSFSGLF